jgi:hypothetical protein
VAPLLVGTIIFCLGQCLLRSKVLLLLHLKFVELKVQIIALVWNR